MFPKLRTEKMSAIKTKNDKGHFCHVIVMSESMNFRFMERNQIFFSKREI
jgi:hypothetical protein